MRQLILIVILAAAARGQGLFVDAAARFRSGIGAPPAGDCAAVEHTDRVYTDRLVIPTVTYSCRQTSAGVYAWQNISSASGSGEANTASNVGTSGIGVFDLKSGADLQFRKVFGVTWIDVSLDSGNRQVNLTIPTAKLEGLGTKLATTDGGQTGCAQWSSGKLVGTGLACGSGGGGGSGDMIAANNLSDLVNIATARTNLGLGGAATQNVGSGAGTVAAGDDSRIVGAAQKSANLSDLVNIATARANLGLGGSAVLSVGTAAGTVAAGDDSRITGAAQKSANLGDLASASTARSNLGLGGAAVLGVGTAAGTVAAGDHGHLAANITNAPSASISAITVQGAIDELSGEKQNADADLTAIANLNCVDGEGPQKVSGSWACVAGGGGGGATSVAATFSSGATTGTLTHNFGSATHDIGCWDVNGEVTGFADPRGTNADSFTFPVALPASTVCIATAGGSGGGGGGASTALSTLYSLGASGTAKTVDPANGWTQITTLSGNCTITFAQPSAGTFANVRIGVTQASSGGPYTVTFAGTKWPGGIAPVMTAGAGKVDWYACLLDGTNAFCTAAQDFQ